MAAGILFRRNRVLICQRAGPGAFDGKWEFPGGKLQEGESAAQALIRELDEELEIRVRAEDLRFLERLLHQYPGGPLVELHFFQVLAFEKEPVNRSFRSMRWVPRSSARCPICRRDCTELSADPSWCHPAIASTCAPRSNTCPR